MSRTVYTPPKVGEVLEFQHNRGPMHLEVLAVHVFRETYDPAWSMWAVTARITRHHKRRLVGKVDTWHLNPGEFARARQGASRWRPEEVNPE